MAYDNPETIRPIFIIDEADKLKYWDRKDAKALLVAITKQDNKGMVIMSTSDDFFREWFRNDVNEALWTEVGVGYFSEAHAKEFLSLSVAFPSDQTRDFLAQEWIKIYKVCGGCPMLLENVAVDVFSFGKPLDKVLSGMVDAMLPAVKRGLSITGFKEIMELLIKRTNGSVGTITIGNKVFGGNVDECSKQLKRVTCCMSVLLPAMWSMKIWAPRKITSQHGLRNMT